MKALMEKRFATCRVSKAAKNDDGTYTFTITTPAVDRVGDSVEPLGGDFRAFVKNPVVLYGHDYGDLPVGRVEKFDATGSGVTANVRFASEIDEFAARVERFVEAGFLRSVSIGFRTLDIEPMPEGRGYRIKRWEMMELSIVPVPANSEALIAAKGVGIVGIGETKPPDGRDAERLKAWAAPVAEPTLDVTVAVKEPVPKWAKAIAADLQRIKEALGLDEDNGDDPAANEDADLLDPDEVDDSPALTDALAAIDADRLGE